MASPQRYPDSIFDAQAPELEANVLLAMNNAAGAQQVLDAAASRTPRRTGRYQLAAGRWSSRRARPHDGEERSSSRFCLTHPLSPEAQTARASSRRLGAEATLTSTELRSLGDAYYNAGRYERGRRAISRPGSAERRSDTDARNGFAVAAAACDLKLKRLTPAAGRGACRHAG